VCLWQASTAPCLNSHCRLVSSRRAAIAEQLDVSKGRALMALQAPNAACLDHTGAEVPGGALQQRCGVPTRRFLLSAAVPGNASPGERKTLHAHAHPLPTNTLQGAHTQLQEFDYFVLCHKCCIC